MSAPGAHGGWRRVPLASHVSRTVSEFLRALKDETRDVSRHTSLLTPGSWVGTVVLIVISIEEGEARPDSSPRGGTQTRLRAKRPRRSSKHVSVRAAGQPEAVRYHLTLSPDTRARPRPSPSPSRSATPPPPPSRNGSRTPPESPEDQPPTRTRRIAPASDDDDDEPPGCVFDQTQQQQLDDEEVEGILWELPRTAFLATTTRPRATARVQGATSP